jgi:hypothetical protein
VHQGGLKIDITSEVGVRKSDGALNDTPSIDARHFHLVDLDHKPLPAAVWLEQACVRLKATPDCPTLIGRAACRLAPDMWEASRRCQVDACWDEGYIENYMLRHGLWKRTKRTKKDVLEATELKP